MPITTPKVPDGLPELMRGLAKSVIKENPENIYVHAAEYFENLIRERDGDLDKGYGSFSAYKVYSDYKDKCREKGGSGSVPAKAVSDGDDDDSGGSASAAARGRRRKRVRKQGSKSVEKDDVPGSASSGGGGGENLSSIKEDAPLTEKTVEEEPIKVETRKEVQAALSKAISIDSEAAANAVSTVLEDTVLDSDEADRETGEVEEPLVEAAEWENLKQPINCEDLSSYPAEDYGSAPSTAEVVGEVVGDGEIGVQDAPSTEETTEKNSDEVDLTVSDKPEAEESAVNGSVEAEGETPKKVSEEPPEPEEGIDTVDAENNEAIAIEPRMRTDNDDNELNMPEVPTDEPGETVEKAEAAQEEPETQGAVETPEIESKENVADENLAESAENGTKSEEPQPEMQESPTENNADDKHNSVSNTPKNSEDQESSEPAEQEYQIEEPQPEESSKLDESSLEKSGLVEEPEPETAGSLLEKTEPEANGNEEQATEEEGQETNKEASDDGNQKSSENDPPTTGSPQKSRSIDVEEKLIENPEAPALNENQPQPQKAESIEETNEQAEGDRSGNTQATDEDQMSGKVEQPATESDSPKESASVDEHQQSNQDVTPPPENDKSADAANESVGENAEEDQNSNQDEAPAAESGSPNKSASINVANDQTSNEQQDSPPQDEDQKSEQGEETNILPKEAEAMDETNKPALEEQISAPPEEEAPPDASSSPQKSASLEDQELSDPAKQESHAEDNPKADSIEDPPPETNSKESSLERTESEPNASGDQSKESSAKESEADATASKRDASEEAGEVSIGSRMGAEDENEEGSPEPSAPPSEAPVDEGDPGSNSGEKLESGGDNNATAESESKNNEEKESKQDSVEEENSKEEAVEEPCIQRQVSPSTSKPLSKNHSTDLEEIKKVDLASFNKDSAEALFYSLKKTELANEEAPKKEDGEQDEDDDDADVVLGEEAPAVSISRQLSKRSFTDDFLVEGPITEEAPNQAEGGGVADEDDEQFNPMMIATARNQQLQEQLHFRDDTSLVGSTQRKTPIRRSMTERVDLVKQDSNYVDLRKYDPDYVQEEDDFDGYYIGNIKNKILASSVSVADSDDFDPRQSQEIIDDNNVRTALETIASTDTESTLPSQITVQANRGFLKNTSSNIPYASFGNNAIDQSLDEFIEREEQNKEAEEQAAASKIQRSYRQFRSNKKKLLRDYHSTMQTCTEDQSTESLEEYPNNIIKIKVDQKQPEALQGEESESNSIEDGRAENRRRPMYSLNIDEYDTAARRMTLTRGVAMQRTSTPEEDSGKSDNTSGDNKKSPPLTSSEPETKVAEGSTISTSGPSSTEDKKEEASSSDEKENKDTGSSKSNDGSSKVDATTKARPLSDSRKHTSLDAQKLFIARQRTMPVQIDASVIRVLPKHMRKRNKSAGMVRK